MILAKNAQVARFFHCSLTIHAFTVDLKNQ